MENREGIDFLKEYRAHPERYYPLTDRQYEHFDEWEDEIVRNLCWSACLLEGNRPYFTECWKIFGVTSITVNVSVADTTPHDIVRMIQEAGLVDCVNPEKAKIHFKKHTDKTGNEFIGVNSVISTEDDDHSEQYQIW